MAGGVLGAAFALRAGGDMSREGGTLLSWLSPLGWGQQTAPFVLDRWWPLGLAVLLGAGTAAVGFTLSARRDVGASLFAVRPGRERAAPWLGTALGLAFRLQRASLLAWGGALLIGGLLFGAYTDALIGALGDMPDVFVELFGGADSMVAGYLAYMATFMAFLASAYAILAVKSLRTEETSGRAEPVLATPVSRWAWLGSNLAVTAVAVVLIMAVTGFATGVGAALVTGDSGHLWDLTLAHLNQVPAVWLVLGATALLYGVLPRALQATWVIVVYGIFMGTFAGLMEVPDAAFALSPFEHPAGLPLASFEALPLLVLTVLALGTAALGLVGFRRRGVNVA
jgi:ABC-2 type transport system permease protein